MKWRIVALAAGSVLFLAAALLFAKVSPVEAASMLIKGSLGSGSAFGGTLREATPLLIAGLAVFVALRAGLFNIGVEGQLTVGALACAAVALHIPGFLGLAVGTLAAMLVGAGWALPAGLIRAYRNGHEVITTIMLNSVAVYLTSYLVEGPLKSKILEEPSTDTLSAASRLPNLYSAGNFQFSAGLLIGIVATVGIAIWLQRTISGYELQAVGANPTAARFAGVDPKRVIVRSMLLSGAIAGLAGAVQVLAYEGRFYVGFSPGYGFDALGVALLAGNTAIGLIPAGLLFGILIKGGVALQVDNVPKGITTVILGLLILIAAAVRYRGVKTVA